MVINLRVISWNTFIRKNSIGIILIKEKKSTTHREQICESLEQLIEIYLPSCWRLCVKKIYLSEIYFVMYPLIYVSLFRLIHVSNILFIQYCWNIILKERPHIRKMCWVTNLNHTPSQLASWMTIISIKFEDILIIIYFVERHDTIIDK